DKLQIGDQVQHELPIWPQRLLERVTPLAELNVAHRQKRTDQTLKGLRQRRIGNVALVLIELAGSEKAARRYQHRLQLVDDRRLAHARIARDKDQFRGASLHNAIEGGEQGLDLAKPPIEFLRDEQPVGRVVSAEWKFVNPALRLPFALATAQVAFESG